MHVCRLKTARREILSHRVARVGRVRRASADRVREKSINTLRGTSASWYEPYGEVSATGSSNNPYQYTGRENDGTGLYYYRARYYSPSLKRFISEDPMGLAAGLNSYAYVGGNPIAFRDPLGLFWTPGDALPQGLVDAGAGLGDALLFDQGGRLRDALGIDGGIDPCSGSYKGGQLAGIAAMFIDGEGELLVGREAANLAEQLALEEAMGGAGERIMQGLIKDPRFPEDVYAKMQHVHESLTSGENIVIHYWQNLESGAMFGFKFK